MEEGERAPGIHFLHMRVISRHSGNPDKTASSLLFVDVRYVFATISQSYSVNNGDLMHDLDQAVSYLQRLGCAVMTLKPEQRASLK